MSEEDRLKTEEMKEKLEKGVISDADLEEQVSVGAGKKDHEANLDSSNIRVLSMQWTRE